MTDQTSPLSMLYSESILLPIEEINVNDNTPLHLTRAHTVTRSNSSDENHRPGATKLHVPTIDGLSHQDDHPPLIKEELSTKNLPSDGVSFGTDPARPRSVPKTVPLDQYQRSVGDDRSQPTTSHQGDHASHDTHRSTVADTTGSSSSHTTSAPLGQTAPTLLDPALALAADIIDDIERVRIANENRLRQLTRSTEDADGNMRGFGLDETHPDVARLAAMVDTLKKVEHDAELELNRKMRKHPLGPWVRAQKGIGDKQAARLLATIGDPYVNSSTQQPRTVSALWRYCGLHVLQVDHGFSDSHIAGVDLDQHPDHQLYDNTQGSFVVGDNTPSQVSVDAQDQNAGGSGGDPDQPSYNTQPVPVGVAPKRRKGEKSTWSTKAKTRVYLVAESCIKQLSPPCRTAHTNTDTLLQGGSAVLRHSTDCTCSPYRVIYDHGRAKYADAIHVVDCVRCGPSGKPAKTGTPLSAGHMHARAMRLVMKEILKGLWCEARRLHNEN